MTPSPADPNIYCYYGGPDCPHRFADPLAVERKLRTLLGADGAVVEQYSSPLAEVSLAAAEKFFQAVAYAFGVPAFDVATGKGFREDELIALWNGFQEWRKKKPTSTGTCPTSAPPTASGPWPNGSATNNSAAWSGMPAASRLAGHGAS